MIHLDLEPRQATPEPERWNPRYVLYAQANGREPEVMFEHDREAFPGGGMAGFVIWISQRWGEWRALRGYRRDDPLTEKDHADFDAWLTEQVKATAAGGVA